jgi:hypothetical protein
MKKTAIIIMILIALIMGGCSSLESEIQKLESEMLTLDENIAEMVHENKQLEIKLDEEIIRNNELEKKVGEIEEKLVSIDNKLLKAENEDLLDKWHGIWDEVYQSEGVLRNQQLDEINHLLRPTFTYNRWVTTNPLSCFFTSYYEDIRDIDIEKFLQYFPNGEVPDVLDEFEELKGHENWFFGDAMTFDGMPVPIHRYESRVVQEIFDEYANISLNELTGVGGDEIIYLDSTDAYYNFTSDFAAARFICTSLEVENDIIRLYDDPKNREPSVLTIAKDGEKYFIESFEKNKR